MDSPISFERRQNRGGTVTPAESEADADRAGEFGRLLLVTVKKHPLVYAEFLRLAEEEEAAREARLGCSRCRGKKVVIDEDDA